MKPESVITLLVGLVVTVAGWLVFFPRHQGAQPAPGPAPAPIIIQPDGRPAPQPVIVPAPPWYAPFWPWYRPAPIIPVPTPVPVPRPVPVPTPVPVPRPVPVPTPYPAPHPRPRIEAEPGRPVEGGKVSPDGTEEIQCDLPDSETFHNKGGRDGSGLCVFASITWAAKYQNERGAMQLFDKMRQEPGGGYPEKVDRMMGKYCQGVPYIQYEGNDLAVPRAALATGRMIGTTYNGHDCHYSGSVSHMVDLVHLTDRWAAIWDNNFPKENQIVWMSPQEYKQRWTGGSRSGWLVILLKPPPPPVPHSLTP